MPTEPSADPPRPEQAEPPEPPEAAEPAEPAEPAEQNLAALDAEAARLGLALDEAARSRFAGYLRLIEAWRERAGLTSLTEPDAIQRRHFGESLALLVALRERGLLTAGAATSVVDVGAGAGFPGLPMLIADPALQLTLLESNRRRCDFLRAAAQRLALEDVGVVAARAEEAGRDPELRACFDVAVARAVAPLPVLVEYALPLLRPGGVLAAPKGSRAADELREAAAAIEALGGCVEPSLELSLPEGVPPQQVLLVRRCGELPERFPRRAGMPSKRPLA